MRINKKGFTLLEILLVIGIIAILDIAVMATIDPAKRFEDAQNSKRLSDIQSIFSAVQQYFVDNKGSIPSGLDMTEKQLGTRSSGCELMRGKCSVNTDYCLNLSSDLAKYLKEIPHDPQNGSTEATRYSIVLDSNE